mmetsp:Transcript_108662/g.171450  ORF Transcript_108662/g.171450 Transcript_108662/m.171450 type:complete len:205 (+) Transcript_108662:115-729(+)
MYISHLAILGSLLFCSPSVLENLCPWHVHLKEECWGGHCDWNEYPFTHHTYLEVVQLSDRDQDGMLNRTEMLQFSMLLCQASDLVFKHKGQQDAIREKMRSVEKPRISQQWYRILDKSTDRHVIPISELMRPNSEKQDGINNALYMGMHEGTMSCAWIVASFMFQEEVWFRPYQYWISEPICQNVCRALWHSAKPVYNFVGCIG